MQKHQTVRLVLRGIGCGNAGQTDRTNDAVIKHRPCLAKNKSYSTLDQTLTKIDFRMWIMYVQCIPPGGSYMETFIC